MHDFACTMQCRQETYCQIQIRSNCVKSKRVFAHILIALMLYNIMAMGANQMMEKGEGILWMICGLGGAFGLGFQLRGLWNND